MDDTPPLPQRRAAVAAGQRDHDADRRVRARARACRPATEASRRRGQVVDNTVLLATATPVALGVLVYFAYALWAFRERNPEVVVDGPAIRGNSSVQFWWLIVDDRRSCCSSPATARSGCSPTGRAAARGRTRSPIPAAPAGPAAAGPGDRAAVAVHLPLPGLRRRRDARSSSCRPTRWSSST